MVIPLYNKQAHILDTIESVLAQTVDIDEVIVVDDGSTDQGGWIVRERQYDNVRVIRQKNQGVSAARNHGIKASKGDYVALIDADDSWSPHFLAELESLIQAFPEADLFATSYMTKVGDSEYLQPKLSNRLCDTRPHLLDNYFEVASRGDLPFIASSFAIDRKMFDYGYQFPEGEPLGEDQSLYSEIALNGQIAYSPRQLAYYRIDAENRACINNVPKKECPFSQRLYRVCNEDFIDNTTRNDILRYTAAHLLHLAKLNARSGHYREALTLLNDIRCWKRPFHRLFWAFYCRTIPLLKSRGLNLG